MKSNIDMHEEKSRVYLGAQVMKQTGRTGIFTGLVFLAHPLPPDS